MVAKELCEIFDRQENCAMLVVPKIIKELWLTSTMQKTTKTNRQIFSNCTEISKSRVNSFVHSNVQITRQRQK